MEAIEFTAKAKNGLIQIPKEYRESLGHEFRVIIFVEPQPIKKRRSFPPLR